MSRTHALDFHPFANVFPMLDETALGELADDIRERGLVEPITLYAGTILDGRNRYRACQVAGVEPRFETYAGDDPAGYVASKNLHRRHLTDDQRRIAAARLVTMGRGRPVEMPQVAAISRERAAELMKVDAAGVERARAVLKHGSPETVAAVERGDLSVASAARLAKAPATRKPDRQRAPDPFAAVKGAHARDAKNVGDFDRAEELISALDALYREAQPLVRQRIRDRLWRVLDTIDQGEDRLHLPPSLGNGASRPH